MKKTLIISTILMLVFAAASYATETRVMTMGDNNMLLLDEANVFLFPSRIHDWPSVAVGEFGDNEFATLGMHWKLGKKGKEPWYLGTYFHNNSTSYSDLWMSPFYSAFPGVNYGAAPEYVPFDDNSFMNSNKRMDLLYGRTFGKTKFGFHLGIVHSSERNDGTVAGVGSTAKDEASMGVYDLNFGVTTKEGLLDLAFGIEFVSFTDKGTDTLGAAYDKTKSRGNHRVHFVGRSFYEYDKNYTFIPHLGLSSGSYEAEYYDDSFIADSNIVTLGQTNKYTRTTVDLGAGVQYAPSSSVLTVLDIGIMYDKLTGEFTPAAGASEEATSKTISFPYFKLGFDAAVFKWMDIRFGATSYWNRETVEDPGNNEYFSSRPDNATYLGFGFHWGHLHVDTQTDPGLFLRGFDFINGADHTEDMNVRISAAYEI